MAKNDNRDLEYIFEIEKNLLYKIQWKVNNDTIFSQFNMFKNECITNTNLLKEYFNLNKENHFNYIYFCLSCSFKY